ncbi:hypothetical protein CSHISOI_03368 [Colletotrichum shisoi]|uniref:DUF2306 domain-containing protein n=1 Tax=Colletotrichum shisoi TaxID=2078593 RepID=A0A5Q4BYF7_9PEZI|nr:hypothetical protein CSHISOI_03368 [Colletotrichum shisoi]
MATPAFIISAHGAAFFTGLTPGDAQIKARILSSFGGVVHIGSSLVVMGLGPFQFLPHLRQQYPAVHRWTGGVYVLAVIVGGVAAFHVTLNSESLPWGGEVGFALLALGWLETARQSIVAIWRDGDIKGHQAWMTRNFSLTYAAVMLRWQLPLMMRHGHGSKVCALHYWIRLMDTELVVCRLFCVESGRQIGAFGPKAFVVVLGAILTLLSCIINHLSPSRIRIKNCELIAFSLVTKRLAMTRSRPRGR